MSTLYTGPASVPAMMMEAAQKNFANRPTGFGGLSGPLHDPNWDVMLQALQDSGATRTSGMEGIQNAPSTDNAYADQQGPFGAFGTGTGGNVPNLGAGGPGGPFSSFPDAPQQALQGLKKPLPIHRG